MPDERVYLPKPLNIWKLILTMGTFNGCSGKAWY